MGTHHTYAQKHTQCSWPASSHLGSRGNHRFVEPTTRVYAVINVPWLRMPSDRAGIHFINTLGGPSILLLAAAMLILVPSSAGQTVVSIHTFFPSSWRNLTVASTCFCIIYHQAYPNTRLLQIGKCGACSFYVHHLSTELRRDGDICDCTSMWVFITALFCWCTGSSHALNDFVRSTDVYAHIFRRRRVLMWSNGVMLPSKPGQHECIQREGRQLRSESLREHSVHWRPWNTCEMPMLHV